MVIVPDVVFSVLLLLPLETVALLLFTSVVLVAATLVAPVVVVPLFSVVDASDSFKVV